MNRKNLTLAELSEMYVSNKDNFDKIYGLINYKPKTFRTLTLQEGQEAYNKMGRERYEYYAAHPTEEIMELRPTSAVAPIDQTDMIKQRDAELELLRKQLETERQQLEIEKQRLELDILRKELGKGE